MGKWFALISNTNEQEAMDQGQRNMRNSETKTTRLTWLGSAFGIILTGGACESDFNDVGSIDDAKNTSATDADASSTSTGGAGRTDGKGGSVAAGAGGGNSTNGSSGSLSSGSTITDGTADGGTTDGGTPDGGTTDGGTTDGGTTDGGSIKTPACDNGVLDGDETDVDCGGAECLPCPEGSVCRVDADCSSDDCVAGLCEAPALSATCFDAERNGNETDVDCGGDCDSCATGERCIAGTDCESERCVAKVCNEPRSELDDCLALAEDILTYKTDAELSELLIGRWLLCPHLADPPTPPTIVGIEFTSDEYFYLVENASGELECGVSSGAWHPETEGESTATTAAPIGQSVLAVPDGGGTSFYRPQFSDNPAQMRVDPTPNLFHSTVYVRARED